MSWCHPKQEGWSSATLHIGLPLLLMVCCEHLHLRMQVWGSALNRSLVNTGTTHELDAIPGKWLQYPCNLLICLIN